MSRTFVYAAAALVLFAGFTQAADEAKKKKKKAAAGLSGEIVKVDAEKGTLTLKVAPAKKKGTAEEKEIKVGDKTTATVIDGEKKTELKADKAADLLKNAQFKAGAKATVETNEDGSAKAITLGEAAAKKKKKKAAE